MNQNQLQPLINMRQLVIITGRSRAFLNNAKNCRSKYFDPDFPQPLKFGKGRNSGIAWRPPAIARWLDVIEQRKNGA